MTAPDTAQTFADQAMRFADDVGATVQAAFDPDPTVEVQQARDRYVVTTLPVSLRKNGCELATLTITIRCCLDTVGKYLAVEKSTYSLVSILTKEPIIRWDYEREAHSKPASHIHVHAHRGELSHVLSQTEHPNPHSLSALHIPTGGPRLRPSIEDVAQFLIDDCGFDGRKGWRTVIEANRVKYRKTQIRSLVRDAPEDAAAVLRDLGYAVEPPGSGVPEDKMRPLRMW